jgi:hypothetical protein
MTAWVNEPLDNHYRTTQFASFNHVSEQQAFEDNTPTIKPFT